MSNQIIGRSQCSFSLPQGSTALCAPFPHTPSSAVSAVDEMGGRIDDLEKSIEDLLQQTGANASAPLPAESKDGSDST